MMINIEISIKIKISMLNFTFKSVKGIGLSATTMEVEWIFKSPENGRCFL